MFSMNAMLAGLPSGIMAGGNWLQQQQLNEQNMMLNQLRLQQFQEQQRLEHARAGLLEPMIEAAYGQGGFLSDPSQFLPTRQAGGGAAGYPAAGGGYPSATTGMPTGGGLPLYNAGQTYASPGASAGMLRPRFPAASGAPITLPGMAPYYRGAFGGAPLGLPQGAAAVGGTPYIYSGAGGGGLGLPQMVSGLRPPAVGMPPFSAVAPSIMGPESGFNPLAQNPASSASGLFQNIKPTWDEWKRTVPGAEQFPTAKSAPPEVQYAVNENLYNARGTTPWAAPGIPHILPNGQKAPPWWGAGGANAAPQEITGIAQNIVPPQMTGMMAMRDAVQLVQQIAPNAPAEVKLSALEGFRDFMNPVAKQDFEQTMSVFKEQREEEGVGLRRQEYGLEEREFAEKQREFQELAPYREAQIMGAGKGWELYEAGGKLYRINKDTGQTEPVSGLPEGEVTKVGTPSAAGGGKWSDEAINAAVEQALMGSPIGLAQLPRSGPARKQFEEALAKKLAAQPGGLGGGVSQMQMNQLRMAEAKSAAHTAGRVTMNTAVYVKEAEGAGRLVIEASKKVPRTRIPAINVIEEAGLKHTGDPAIVELGVQINALLNAYGKMSNPTGTGIHDADKARLENILSAALGQPQIEGAVRAIVSEGNNVSWAAQQAQEEVLRGLIPQAPGAAPAPGAPPAQAAPQSAPAGIVPGGGPSGMGPAGQPTATDPKTGKKVIWNGTAWVPQ